MMAGYSRGPDGTATALQNGWMHTGDIGVVDAEGYSVTLIGRKK